MWLCKTDFGEIEGEGALLQLDERVENGELEKHVDATAIHSDMVHHRERLQPTHTTPHACHDIHVLISLFNGSKTYLFNGLRAALAEVAQ